MRKNRKLAHRRERRKAKASNWKREPKRKMGVVSHGGTGSQVVDHGSDHQEKSEKREKKPKRKLGAGSTIQRMSEHLKGVKLEDKEFDITDLLGPVEPL